MAHSSVILPLLSPLTSPHVDSRISNHLMLQLLAISSSKWTSSDRFGFACCPSVAIASSWTSIFGVCRQVPCLVGSPSRLCVSILHWDVCHAQSTSFIPLSFHNSLGLWHFSSKQSINPSKCKTSYANGLEQSQAINTRLLITIMKPHI